MNNSGLRDSYYKVSHLYDGDSEPSPTSRIAAMRLSRNGQEVGPRTSSKSANVQQQANWEEIEADTDLSWSRRSEPGKKRVHKRVTTTVTTLEPGEEVSTQKQTFTSTQQPPADPNIASVATRVDQTVTRTNIQSLGQPEAYPTLPSGPSWQNPVRHQGRLEVGERQRYGPGDESPGSLDKGRRKPLYVPTRGSVGFRDEMTAGGRFRGGDTGITSTGVVDTYSYRSQEIFGQGQKANPADTLEANQNTTQVTRTFINRDETATAEAFGGETNTRVETGGANIFMGQGDSFSREEQNVIDSAMFASKINQQTVQFSSRSD